MIKDARTISIIRPRKLLAHQKESKKDMTVALLKPDIHQYSTKQTKKTA